MTTSITARDKKLLYGLGIIVIIALFYIIGIRPMNRKITKIEKEIDEAQLTFDTIKMKLFQLDSLTEFRDNAVKLSDELSARYYEKMVPAEVDKMITTKALGYGLKVNNLTILEGTSPAAISAYSNSKIYNMAQNAGSDSGSEEEEEEEETTEETGKKSHRMTEAEREAKVKESMVDIEILASVNNDHGMYTVSDTTQADIYCTTVTLDVYGSQEKAQELLDELIRNKSLRVSAYEWTDMTSLPYEYVNGQLVAVDTASMHRLIIKFDMYMYDNTRFKSLTTSSEAVVEEEETTEEDPDAEIKEEIEQLR